MCRNSLRGKWALVTGATRGLGKLLAIALAEQGCHLVLHGRDAVRLAGLSEKLRGHNIHVMDIAADFCLADRVTWLLNSLDEARLALDLIVNNAAIQVAPTDPFWQTPQQSFETSFQVNTIAPIMICHHWLPKMLSRGSGRIINLTSGIEYEPNQPAYAASKAALNKFTHDMAPTLAGTGVAMNCVDPGWCRTDLGGPMATYAPESAITGILALAGVAQSVCGYVFEAQKYTMLSVSEAITAMQGDAERRGL